MRCNSNAGHAGRVLSGARNIHEINKMMRIMRKKSLLENDVGAIASKLARKSTRASGKSKTIQ